MNKPIVAIVGRPNVGKSTLFNRIVGQRKTIVEDLPGTTRDRISIDTAWQGREFTLLDTGGYELRPDTDIRQKVKEQVGIAVEEADIIIFLVDARDGVVPADMEIAGLLRRSGKPVLLGVNKVDSPRQKAEALVFHELSIGEPIPLSAYHRAGTGDLLDRLAELLPAKTAAGAAEGMMKIAIVGRPNVGKSMLLNALLGQDRAIVSDLPGTTRDAIDTIFQQDGESILLIDTAGIKRAGHISGGIERYSVIRALDAIERCDIALLVTDISDIITAQDTHIAGYVKEAAKGIVVIVNKWDLAATQQKVQVTSEIRRRLKFLPPMPVLFVSAKDGSSVEDILPAARQVYQERLKRIPTAVVNGIIQSAVASHPPRMVKGRQLKILYVTQAEVNPPTFIFFVNDARLRHFSYDRYLENKMREVFGFMGTPLRFVFKARKETR